MKSFYDCWAYTDQVYGSFSKNEAKAMYDILITLPSGSIVVEIGSYCGRSASLIGQIAGQQEKGFEFYCIDNFITGWEDKDVKSIFESNMKNIKHDLLYMNSKRAAHLFDLNEIDFLFIDGDHLYQGVKNDIQRWMEKVKSGGCILFHDYNSSWEGVKRAVDEDLLSYVNQVTPYLIKKGDYDSLLVTQKT